MQDPYTLRCAPQVLGAARDALDYCARVFAAELEAVTDNPLVFPDDGDVLSGGNFHGQPLALALDFLAIALAQVASFSERRTYSLMGPHVGGLWREALAALPDAGAGPEFGLHDRAVCRRGAGERDQGAGASRQHRLDSDLGGHGRLREHGRDGGHQAAAVAATGLARRRHRADLRRAGAGVPQAAAAGRGVAEAAYDAVRTIVRR